MTAWSKVCGVALVLAVSLSASTAVACQVTSECSAGEVCILGVCTLERHLHRACGLYRAPQHFEPGPPDPEALEILRDIAEGAGLANLPVLLSDPMSSNAMAMTDARTGTRFIFYDPEFLASMVTKSGTTWAAKFILAHELGHHAEGHAIVPECSYKAEYEADAFAARAMYRKGADIHETAGAMEAMNHPSGECHPSSASRRSAIMSAWESEKSRLATIASQHDTATRPNSVNEVEAEDEEACGTLIECLTNDKSPGGLVITIPELGIY